MYTAGAFLLIRRHYIARNPIHIISSDAGKYLFSYLLVGLHSYTYDRNWIDLSISHVEQILIILPLKSPEVSFGLSDLKTICRTQ